MKVLFIVYRILLYLKYEFNVNFIMFFKGEDEILF